MTDQDGEEFATRLAKARQGCGDAWGELFYRYRGYLNFLAWFHLDDKLRRKVSAGDLVQETFLRAHRYREVLSVQFSVVLLAGNGQLTPPARSAAV